MMQALRKPLTVVAVLLVTVAIWGLARNSIRSAAREHHAVVGPGRSPPRSRCTGYRVGPRCEQCATGFVARPESQGRCADQFELMREGDNNYTDAASLHADELFGPENYQRSLPPNSFSARFCHGSDFTNTSWHSRTCLFRNLCYSRATEKFIYHRSPAERTLARAEQLESDLSVGVRPLFFNEKTYGRWAPDIVDSPIPRDAFVQANRPVVLYHTYIDENFGHFLWDELLPLFSLQDIYGLVSPNVQVLRLSGPCRANTNCPRLFAQLGALFSWHRVRSLRDNYHFLPPDRVVCFQTLLAGTALLSDHCRDESVHGRKDGPHECNRGRGSLFWRYRNFLLHNLVADSLSERADRPNLTNWDASVSSARHALPPTNHDRLRPDLNESPLPAPCKQLVVVAARGYRIEQRDPQRSKGAKNLPQVEQFLRYHGIPLVSHDMAQVPMDEQLRLISRATVYITLCGGGSAAAMFLPRGASLLLYCPKFRHKLDWNTWNHVSYVSAHYLRMNNSYILEPADTLDFVRHAFERYAAMRETQQPPCPASSSPLPSTQQDEPS